MDKVFIFDVDGTLTPSRQQISGSFEKFFVEWGYQNLFYLVTGSDLPKTQEQMKGLDGMASGIFSCCGNEYWEPDPAVHPRHATNVYTNVYEPSSDLLNYLKHQLEIAPYLARCGNHIENRGSMLNFSVIGRDCTQTQRDSYFKYDQKEGERIRIAKEIRKKWPELDAVIGGQISIDIYPKGKDKSQILEWIQKEMDALPVEQFIFIGDKTEEDGNDYPLAQLMDKTEKCLYHTTSGPEETLEILKSYESEKIKI